MFNLLGMIVALFVANKVLPDTEVTNELPGVEVPAVTPSRTPGKPRRKRRRKK